MNHKYINTRVFQLLSPKDYQPWEWRGEGRDLLGALKSISRVGSHLIGAQIKGVREERMRAFLLLSVLESIRKGEE